MSGLNYARSQRKGGDTPLTTTTSHQKQHSASSTSSSTATRRPAHHVDLALPGHGTTTDQLHAIIAQRERTLELESKMNKLFKKSKDGKERSLMGAQAKIWAAESVKLHKDRGNAEGELKQALEGLSRVLSSGGGGGEGAEDTSLDITDVPFRLAAEAVVDELHEDRSVCRALAEGMIGSIFNIRAGVSMLRHDRAEKRIKSIVAELQRTKAVVEGEMAEWNTNDALATAGTKYDHLYKVLAELQQGGESQGGGHHHSASLLGGGVFPVSGKPVNQLSSSSSSLLLAPSSSASSAPLLAAQRAVSTLSQLDKHISSQLATLKAQYPNAFNGDVDLVSMFKAAIQEVCMSARSEAADVGEGGGGGDMAESVVYDDDFEDYVGGEDDEDGDGHAGEEEHGGPQTNETTSTASNATNRLTAASLPQPTTRKQPEVHAPPSTVASTTLRSRTSHVTFASVDDTTLSRVEEIVKSFKSVTKRSAATSTSTGLGTGGGSLARGGKTTSSMMTPQQANRNRELLHHRIKLEFPSLSTGQIIAICRAVGEGEAEGRKVTNSVQIAAREVHRLLGAFKDALDAQEGYLILEKDRAAWREADVQRQAEQTALLESLRAEKNERDAAALEVQLAEEAKKAAAQEQRDRVREGEFQARVAKLIEYQEEKRKLAEEEDTNRKLEEAILAEEKRKQSESNQHRVAARDAKDQERLDTLRLRNLEIEQEKAAHEQAMERFFSRVQDTIGAKRDFNRVVQPTASSSSVENSDLVPAREAAGRAHRQNGFTDDEILRDPRFRIHEALVAAGLQRTSYARTLVDNGCGYRMSNYNAMSEGNPFSPS